MIKLTACGFLAPLVLAAQASAVDVLAASASLDFHHAPTLEAPVLSLSMDAQAPSDDTAAVEQGASIFGMQDTWRFNVFAGGGFAYDDDKDTLLAFGGAGVSYFLIDNVSLDLELNLMGVDQPGQDAFGVGVNVILRWHIIARETWSIYVDGGAGVLGTTANVPPGAISFNFTPQAGFGATFEVAQDTRLFVGVRLHHLSNANLGDTNEGLDNVLAYAGVSFPF